MSCDTLSSAVLLLCSPWGSCCGKPEQRLQNGKRSSYDSGCSNCRGLETSHVRILHDQFCIGHRQDKACFPACVRDGWGGENR